MFKSNGATEFYTNFVLQPTWLKANTLIDNIFLNSLEFQSNSGNIILEISDDVIQVLILECYTRLQKRFNEREFDEMVRSTDWDDICMLSVKSFKSFYDTLNFHLDEMAPLIKRFLERSSD